jgi:hypothetical protein
MKRAYGIFGLLMAMALVWTGFGFVHGDGRTGLKVFAAGIVLAAASLFLLAIGYPGILKTRRIWTITFVIWLLVAVALLRAAAFI